MSTAGIDTGKHPVVLFDGHCNLCCGWVDFVIKYDEKERFRFAPLQAESGRKIKSNFRVPEEYADSIVLIHNKESYYKSSAALRIFRLLGGIWKMLYMFVIIPPFIRNWVYDFIARHRYKWFGKRDTCRVPTEDERELFL